jgi:hypothetical protein
MLPISHDNTKTLRLLWMDVGDHRNGLIVVIHAQSLIERVREIVWLKLEEDTNINGDP